MSEDPILAALARLEGGQTAMRAEAAGFREQGAQPADRDP